MRWRRGDAAGAGDGGGAIGRVSDEESAISSDSDVVVTQQPALQ